MAIEYQQQQINLTLAQDVAEAKTQLLLQGEALNALERLCETMLGRLIDANVIEPEDPMIQEFRSQVAELRKAGWAKARAKPVSRGVACPGCKAVLKNVRGASGDRCDWCGWEF